MPHTRLLAHCPWCPIPSFWPTPHHTFRQQVPDSSAHPVQNLTSPTILYQTICSLLTNFPQRAIGRFSLFTKIRVLVQTQPPLSLLCSKIKDLNLVSVKSLESWQCAHKSLRTTLLSHPSAARHGYTCERDRSISQSFLWASLELRRLHLLLNWKYCK